MELWIPVQVQASRGNLDHKHSISSWTIEIHSLTKCPHKNEVCWSGKKYTEKNYNRLPAFATGLFGEFISSTRKLSITSAL